MSEKTRIAGDFGHFLLQFVNHFSAPPGNLKDVDTRCEKLSGARILRGPLSTRVPGGKNDSPVPFAGTKVWKEMPFFCSYVSHEICTLTFCTCLELLFHH